jgi:hypothetical protein
LENYQKASYAWVSKQLERERVRCQDASKPLLEARLRHPEPPSDKGILFDSKEILSDSSGILKKFYRA